MSRFSCKLYYEVGDIVYRYGSPVLSGRVVAIEEVGEPGRSRRQRVTVRMPGGEEHEWGDLDLRELRALIDEHRQKLATHERRLAAIEAMP